jgi:methionine aminotransferase
MTSLANSKLAGFGESIFSTMSRMAQQYGAINLSQGFPEFSPPQALLEAVAKAMQSGYNQYAPMPGYLPLKQMVADRCQSELGYSLDPESEITIVPGATAGIYCAIQALVHPGDEVIIIEPAYDCYAPSIIMAGGTVKSVAMNPQTGEIPWDQVFKLVNRHTRMLMVNTPHNPTGWVLSENDWLEIERIADAGDLIVLSDEVYEYMVFDGLHHISAAARPALKDRSVRLSSFGKTYHATGWKMGYISASAAISQRIREVFQFMAFSSNMPQQVGLARFMQEHPKHEAEVASVYQQKRDLLASALAESRFGVLPCQGSYFQLVDYSKISDRTDREFAEELVQIAGVASIPLSPFFTKATDSKLLRLCFAKQESTLLQAAESLCKI